MLRSPECNSFFIGLERNGCAMPAHVLMNAEPGRAKSGFRKMTVARVYNQRWFFLLRGTWLLEERLQIHLCSLRPTENRPLETGTKPENVSNYSRFHVYEIYPLIDQSPLGTALPCPYYTS